MARARLCGDRIRIAGRAAAAWIGAVVLLVAIHVLLPQRSGVIALTQVFEPYIVLSALIAVPVALIARERATAIVALVLVGIFVLRYGPAWVSLPQSTGNAAMTVAAWNVLARPDAARRMLKGLALVEDAAIVGLAELQPAMGLAATTDPALVQRYPYRAFAPDSSVRGVGLLSRFPIVEHSASQDPPYLRAVVQTPDTAQPTVVYVVHPLPGTIQTLGDVPVALDTTRRDADLATIRALIDEDLSAGRPVIVLGDINTTEREPAYATFSAGLRDAHLDAGIGPGFTWRPGWLPSPPFGVVRIDYVFVSPEFRPTSAEVACIAASDHCLVTARLELENGAAAALD